MLTKVELPVVCHAEHRFTGKKHKPAISLVEEPIQFYFTLSWFMCSAWLATYSAVGITLLTPFTCSTDTEERK